MKRFFVKKYIFAACFLACVLVFSAANMFYGREELAELAEELGEVDSVETLQTWIGSVDGALNDAVLGRMGFVETYGYVQKLLDKREFNNFYYVRGNDGMMYYSSLLRGTSDDLVEYAQNVRRMNEVVQQKGAQLLVVLPPAKILSGVTDVDLSWPLNDPNDRMDRFLLLLQQNGVTALDLRPAMQKSGYSLEELFFKTDHHWTPLAAFYAAGELVEQVRQRFGDDWDPTGFYCDLDNYQQSTYPQCMLGSYGRNAGVVYSGLDDYTLLWPKFETNFTWFDMEHKESRSGPFERSLLDLSRLQVSDLYSGSVNMVYLDEVTEHDRIVNHENPNGPKIIALRDSYFSPMACFLAPMCSELDMVWGRSSHNDMDFEAFIRESEYDYVILELYPYNLDEKNFDFFHGDDP